MDFSTNQTEISPFERFNGTGSAAILVLCDHASNKIPQSMDNLGISGDVLDTHIGWDIGARTVAERFVERSDGRGIFCGTSRVVIDCNRPLSNLGRKPSVENKIIR